MKVLQRFQDAMGRSTDVLAFSEHRCAVTLAAGIGKTVSVPPRACVVLFNATAPFWIQYGKAATLPAGDLLDGGAPELAPGARQIAGLSVLGLIAPQDCTVSLSFFGG